MVKIPQLHHRKQSPRLRLFLVCHLQIFPSGEVRVLRIPTRETNCQKLHRPIPLDPGQEIERRLFQGILQHSRPVSLLLLLLRLPQKPVQIRQHPQRPAIDHFQQSLYRRRNQQQKALLLKMDSRSGDRQYLSPTTKKGGGKC